jgi:hypothetical protein
MALDEEVDGWFERAFERETLLVLALDVALSLAMGRGGEWTGDVERGGLERSDQPEELDE